MRASTLALVFLLIAFAAATGLARAPEPLLAAAAPAAKKPAAAAPTGQKPAATDKPAPTDKPAAGDKKKEHRIIIKAPDGTLTYDDTTGLYIITDGTLEDTDSESILSASHIEFNDKDRWAKATGNPHMWDKNNDITGDTLNADFKVKRVDVMGNVRLVTKPKEAKTEQGKRTRDKIKEPVTVYCDKMEYFYKDKKGTAEGNLRILQKTAKADRTATGDHLLYDGNDETVVLDGNVHVTDTKGQVFDCRKVTITTKEGAEGFRAEGISGSSFEVKVDEENKPAEGGSETKPSAPAPAGESKPARNGG